MQISNFTVPLTFQVQNQRLGSKEIHISLFYFYQKLKYSRLSINIFPIINRSIIKSSPPTNVARPKKNLISIILDYCTVHTRYAIYIYILNKHNQFSRIWNEKFQFSINKQPCGKKYSFRTLVTLSKYKNSNSVLSSRNYVIYENKHRIKYMILGTGTWFLQDPYFQHDHLQPRKRTRFQSAHLD